MAISSQKIKTHIAYIENGTVKTTASNKESDTAIIYALSGEKIERRQHIKPFTARHRLKTILPSLQEDALLQQEKERVHVLSTEGLNEHQFLSLSVPKDVLSAEEITLKKANITPIIGTTITPLGLTAFAEKDTRTAIITRGENNEIYAILSSGLGKLLDFRIFPENGIKWKNEAQATLNGWHTHCELSEIKIESGLYIPAFFKKNAHVIQNSKETPLPIQGLSILFNEQFIQELTFPIDDLLLKEKTKKQVIKSNKLLTLLFIILVFLTIGLEGYNFILSQKEKKAQIAQENIFYKILPTTPLIDIELQLKRELNRLQLATGNALTNKNTPITDQLVLLANKMSNIDMNARFKRISLSAERIFITGSIESLSEVDRFKRLLENMYKSFEFKLKSAEVNKKGSVDFTIEGQK